MDFNISVVSKISLVSLISLVVLFLLTKLMGNKQVSQLNMFDYIIGISIGSIAAELATDLEDFWQPFTALVIYGVVAYLVSVITSKSLKTRKVIVGRSLILMDNGVIYKKNLSKARIDVSDFMMQCRIAGFFDLNEIQTAIFEYNGNISFLPVSGKRPVNPDDLKLEPEYEYTQVTVILDKHINHFNLKKTGNNITWLNKQLNEQGYSNAGEILLGLCDHNNKLTLYPVKTKNDPSDLFE